VLEDQTYAFIITFGYCANCDLNTEEKLIGGKNTLEVKQAFGGLVDAMRFTMNKAELDTRYQELEDIKHQKLNGLEAVEKGIVRVIQSSATDVGEEYTSELSRQISGFTTIATEQTRRRIEERFAAESGEIKISIDRERIKIFKSLESLLAVSPFPVLEKTVTVKYVDGVYASRLVSKCTEGIQYEFSLDTKRSTYFKDELHFSAFEKEIKLPVSLGKSWLRKDPVPDFDKLDQYTLTSAEITDTSLLAVFSRAERNAEVRIAFTAKEGHRFPTVTYSDSERTINFASEPSLNKYLDNEAIERAMERLWRAVVELEIYKVGLSRLICGSEEVLSKLDCLPFLAISLRYVAPMVVNVLESQKGAEEKQDAATHGGLDEAYVREKVASLGENGAAILHALGIKS